MKICPVKAELFLLGSLLKDKHDETDSLFDVHVTVHRRHSEGKEPTRCDKVCSFYCLNMFRAPIFPSSGVQLVNIFRF
jgi:hypothetical protein